MDMDTSLPAKSFEEVALASLNERVQNMPKLKPRKPIWADEGRPINYTRGVYRPPPGPLQFVEQPSFGDSSYDDSHLVSKLWKEQQGGNTESEAEADIEDMPPGGFIDTSPSRVSGQSDPRFFPSAFDPNSNSVFQPISPGGTMKKVTIVEETKSKKGKKKKKKKKDKAPRTDPGPVDFSQYSATARLWMEQVDKQTVQKSKTMYMAVMPELEKPPEEIVRSLPHYEMTSDDVFLPPQWVIARGRTLRRNYREDQMTTQSTTSLGYKSGDSDWEGDGPMSPTSRRQALLFFRVGNNWKDLAWVLFDGLLSDSETVRMVKDIQLKHPGDLQHQVNEMISRWWKKRGADATIEELQRALDYINLGYLREEFRDPKKSVTTYTDTEDELDISEISDTDPDVSRLIGEYNNNSFELDPEAHHNMSSEHMRKSYTSSRGYLDVSRDSPLRRSPYNSFRHDSTKDSLDDTFESKQKFVIVQPQLKNVKVSGPRDWLTQHIFTWLPLWHCYHGNKWKMWPMNIVWAWGSLHSQS